MPIIKNALTPGGAAITFHVAQRIEANVSNTAQALMVQVASWPSSEAYQSANGMSATWSDWYPVPFKALDYDTDLAVAVEQALIVADGPFKGGSYVAASDDLEGAKMRRWANIKMQRELLSSAPVVYGDVTVQADNNSVMKITGAIIGMQAKGETVKKWRTDDNTMHDLSISDLLAINAAIDSRAQSLIDLSDSLYAQIQAAQTVEEVEAIVWPTA